MEFLGSRRVYVEQAKSARCKTVMQQWSVFLAYQMLFCISQLFLGTSFCSSKNRLNSTGHCQVIKIAAQFRSSSRFVWFGEPSQFLLVPKLLVFLHWWLTVIRFLVIILQARVFGQMNVLVTGRQLCVAFITRLINWSRLILEYRLVSYSIRVLSGTISWLSWRICTFMLLIWLKVQNVVLISSWPKCKSLAWNSIY